MIRFEALGVLWLALPWVLVWVWFGRVQRSSLAWVLAQTSPRFRATFSVYTPRSLRWHLRLLLFMGLLLIVAGARPTLSGRTEALAEGRRLLVVLDASASMWADDVTTDSEETRRRFDQAREVALGLVRELGGEPAGPVRLALVTFSGVSTVHLPMTGDLALVEEALRTVEVHNFYQSTGSSLSGALETAVRFQGGEEDPRAQSEADLQVVLLSDGELPYPEDYAAPLEVLEEAEVPVHTVAIGTTEGQGRLIFDFKDVVAGKEEKTVLRGYTTRRVDEHLSRISDRTGGHFATLESGTDAATIIAALREAIESRSPRVRRLEREGVATDLSGWPLLLFLVLFLLDSLVFGHHTSRTRRTFDVEHLGDRPSGGKAAALLLAVLVVAGCDSAIWRAHLDNENGIVRDGLGDHERARQYYEWSAVYRVKPQIPTYNLARSLTLQGEYAEAHRLYQEALRWDSDLGEALFNDGVALYRWGVSERDPRGCELERTHDLWQQALRRFGTVAEAGEESELGAAAVASEEFLFAELERLEELIAEPPEDCPPPPPPSEQAGGGDAGGREEPRQGEPPPPSPPSGEPPSPLAGGEGESPAPGAPPPLSDDELGQIRQELERIARSAREEGKYHRRTLPEQFGKESWSNPESEIWW